MRAKINVWGVKSNWKTYVIHEFMKKPLLKAYVTREFCKNLCVKRDHNAPFATLLTITYKPTIKRIVAYSDVHAYIHVVFILKSDFYL